MKYLAAAFATVFATVAALLLIALTADDPTVGLAAVIGATLVNYGMYGILALGIRVGTPILLLVGAYFVARKLIEANSARENGSAANIDPVAKAACDFGKKAFTTYDNLSPEGKEAVRRTVSAGFWTLVNITKNTKASHKILEARETYRAEKRRIDECPNRSKEGI